MRSGARLVLALLLFLGLTVVLAPTASSASATRARAASLQVSVADVKPSVPPLTSDPSVVTISVQLTNLTGAAIEGIRVVAERDEPIDSTAALAADLKKTATTAPDNGLSVPAVSDVEVSRLAAHAMTTVPYQITTSTRDSVASLCLCERRVYPIFMAAQITDTDGSARTLGAARTYLPSMAAPKDGAVAKRLQVGWVWPLLDRPHRLTGDDVFLDDDLATSVETGGRLDRALQVVEAVGADIPITLLVDPDLIDELVVMATGRYSVESGSTSSTGTSGTPAVATTPGTGQVQAQAWLRRLQQVLTDDQGVQIALTPYGDPDVQTLAGRDLGWTSRLPNTMARRVAGVLAGRTPVTDLAWPSGGVIDGEGLRALAGRGATNLVLDQTALRAGQRTARNSAVHLSVDAADGAAAAQADAAMTAPHVQRWADVTLSRRGSYVTTSRLIAEIAARSIDKSGPTFLAVTPPRYVDPVVERAVRVIRETSTGLIATPVAARTGLSAAAKISGRLSATLGARDSLPQVATDSVTTIDGRLPAVRDLLVPTTASGVLQTGYALARQRVVSSAFRADEVVGGGLLGEQLAQRIEGEIDTLLSGIRIITPSSRNYTFASRDAVLPVAVRNSTQYAVRVRVVVRTVDGLPGLTATPLALPVDARAQTSFPVKTLVTRTGVIPVEAQLTTPTGDVPLGRSVPLTVHGTALGTIGIVITVVAGVVLVLALLVRFVRRGRRRRTPVATAPVVEREPAS